MKIGIVFPQIEFGSTDPLALRDYGQAVEALGFTHLLAYDHILGANPDRPGGWTGPYTYANPFIEPFLLFTYLSAVTTRLEFASGVIILPQRQTALVAKQAATLDVLSNGRLRLGVGLGWNEVEYTALNENFHTRGKRIEEQVEVLRLLWTQELVTYDGRWHHIPDAGLNPMPVQRPIPIWFGGHHDTVLRRVAKMGDGWMPGFRTAADARPTLDTLAHYLEEAGRPREAVGLEPRLSYGNGNPDEWRTTLEGWRTAGATHLSFNTLGTGFSLPEQHLAAIKRFTEEISF
ncbi:MAG: LLM class F420-dependent oxidoreductase [Anaerolineales bacterium]|nr:LLM class F420-dependent oxidoreductase [Anaerolineales bacterium]